MLIGIGVEDDVGRGDGFVGNLANQAGVVGAGETHIVVGPAFDGGMGVVVVDGALPQDGTDLAHLAMIKFGFLMVGNLVQASTMLSALVHGYTSVETQGCGAGALAVGKDMEIGDREAVDELADPLKFVVVLAVEARHDVGGDAGIGQKTLDELKFVGILAGGVSAVHQPEQFVAASLDGDMKVREEGAGVCHKVDDVVGDEVRFDAGDAIALDGFDTVQSLQQLSKRLAIGRTKRACIHARENNLFDTLGGHSLGLFDTIGNGGAARTATGERDGAIGAEIVATLLHLEKAAGAVAR